jgi:inner membrane transporter RhtA
MTRSPLGTRSAASVAVGGMISVQSGAAIAARLFDVVDPTVVLLVRQGVTALVLLAVTRPDVRALTRHQWWTAARFGAAIAVMNLAMYEAIDRLPLGLAVTIELCGPLALSVALARRRLDLAWTALAVAGLLLFRSSSLGAGGSVGIAFALTAAVGWAAYLVAGDRVGAAFTDHAGLAIGLVVASMATAPFALSHDLAPLAEPTVLGAAVAVAVLSALVPFSADLLAVRVLGPKVMSVLVAVNPVVAGVAGYLVLGQRLAAPEVAGMACIVSAAAGAVLLRDRRRARPVADVAWPPETRPIAGG